MRRVNRQECACPCDRERQWLAEEEALDIFDPMCVILHTSPPPKDPKKRSQYLLEKIAMRTKGLAALRPSAST